MNNYTVLKRKNDIDESPYIKMIYDNSNLYSLTDLYQLTELYNLEIISYSKWPVTLDSLIICDNKWNEYDMSKRMNNKIFPNESIKLIVNDCEGEVTLSFSNHVKKDKETIPCKKS